MNSSKLRKNVYRGHGVHLHDSMSSLLSVVSRLSGLDYYLRNIWQDPGQYQHYFIALSFHELIFSHRYLFSIFHWLCLGGSQEFFEVMQGKDTKFLQKN